MVCVKTYKKTIKNCRCRKVKRKPVKRKPVKRCRPVRCKPVKKRPRLKFVTDVVASSLKGLEHFGLTKKKKKR